MSPHGAFVLLGFVSATATAVCLRLAYQADGNPSTMNPAKALEILFHEPRHPYARRMRRLGLGWVTVALISLSGAWWFSLGPR